MMNGWITAENVGRIGAFANRCAQLVGGMMELDRLVREKLRAAESKDYYSLLDVEPGCDSTTLRKSYFKLVKRFHPDRMKATPDLAVEASKVFKALSAAYAVLSDERQRENYNISREMGQNFTPAADRTPIASEEADKDFAALLDAPREAMAGKEVEIANLLQMRGAVVFARGDHEMAARCFKRAHELVPDKPDYLLKLSLVTFNDPAQPEPTRRREARRWLEKAIVANPYHAETRYRMAQFWKDTGEPEQYRRELEAALRCKGKHPRAAKELAQLRADDAAAGQTRNQNSWLSGFGRLFSR